MLLKLSSSDEFSQNLTRNGDGGNSTTSWFVQPLLATYIPLVWAIALSVPKAMREASQKGKADIVPTPLFYINGFPLGIGEAQK